MPVPAGWSEIGARDVGAFPEADRVVVADLDLATL